ncbi:uncharacterized protein, partial [Rutidosis leptorrhynchoides]|uniref:uncharacterized protein n=1 Tax=Rutidosis leptorrhynchoides TaxID=125765 RepID=UPI003A9A1246
SVAAVGKAGGAEWKTLSDAEKAPYVAKAEKRKDDYNKSMEAYNNKLTAGDNDEDEESDKSKSEVHDEDEDDDGERMKMMIRLEVGRKRETRRWKLEHFDGVQWIGDYGLELCFAI